MSMEHLVLGLVLFAGTLAVGNPVIPKAIEVKELDMACTSFDDQYRGCSRMMEEELGELNNTEFDKNSIYAKFWTQAAAKWQEEGRGLKSTALRTEHAVALMAYSLQERQPLYQEFNKAVQEARRSRREYLEKFQFKTLHFLLTQAVGILQKPQKCHNVYRGVRGIRFTAQHQDLVRFGHFASSSFRIDKAKDFGTDTFFFVNTCYGAPMKDFSAFPEEYEVLIPPYERFEVTNITRVGKSTHIHLKSNGIFSNYNCEWVKGDIPCDGPSIPQDCPSIPRNSPFIPQDGPSLLGMGPPSPTTVPPSPVTVPPSLRTVPHTPGQSLTPTGQSLHPLGWSFHPWDRPSILWHGPSIPQDSPSIHREGPSIPWVGPSIPWDGPSPPLGTEDWGRGWPCPTSSARRGGHRLWGGRWGGLPSGTRPCMSPTCSLWVLQR